VSTRTDPTPELVPAAPTRLWPALRNDPGHFRELCLLHAVSQLAPQAGRWRDRARTRGRDADAARLAGRVVRRAWRISRHDGAVSGSSLVVGMPAAMASLYCHQVLMVLELAALYGHDPSHSSRAAEILVLQGRYQSVDAAAEALRIAGVRRERDRAESGGRFAAAWTAARQLPSMIGLHVRKARQGNRFDTALSLVEYASYFVPFIGIPACVAGCGRATRKLGRAATAFYAGDGAGGAVMVAASADCELGFALPPRATPVTRLWFGIVIAVAAAAIIVAVGLTGHQTWLRWLVAVAISVCATAPFARLLWVTRDEAE
jgi:hypothetical protein